MAIITPDFSEIRDTLGTLAAPVGADRGFRVITYLGEKAEPPMVMFTFDGPANWDTGEQECVLTWSAMLLVGAAAGAERAQDAMFSMVEGLVPALDSKSGDGVCTLRVLRFEAFTEDEVAGIGYWGGRLVLEITSD